MGLMKKQNWSREELKASLRSYLEMRQKDLEGKKYKKKEYYQILFIKFSITDKTLNVACRDKKHNSIHTRITVI